MKNVPLWLAAGALAGLVATAPMTLALEGLRRQLPRRQRRALPPSQITTNLLLRVKWLRPLLNRRRHRDLSFLAHFGYGAAAGSLYAPLARSTPGPAVAKGVFYGLLVWAISYLGLLPALGLFPAATKDDKQRQAVMIAGHVVWGGILGGLAEAISRA